MTSASRVAVVGAGVAGLVAAHLLQKRYPVDLIEAEGRLGGHANTFEVTRGPDAGCGIDTGFIVFNAQTYPLFQKFLAELGVNSQLSDMSFGYFCESTGWAYGGHDLNTFFARRHLLLNPDYWRFALDILRFNNQGMSRLKSQADWGGVTLREYLRGYSASFVRHYIMPLGAAIWSSPLERILDFPAQAYVRFLAQHGLLRVTGRPDWFTIPGGSIRYIRAWRERFSGRVLTGRPLERVWRREDRVELRLGGELCQYAAVVLACHADQALQCLADPSPEEIRALSPWRYLPNRAVLHQDTRVLPPLIRVRASWNYRRSAGPQSLPTLTYDMNRLQRLKTHGPYLVTLNPTQAIEERSILGEWTYRHPQYDVASLSSQAELPALNRERTAFCGSYHGYGFHEDAVRSGVAAAASLGCGW